jgi:MFS family permease
VDEPTFAELLSKPALWGTMLGHGFNLYAFYFVISWLPTYLVKVQGLSVREMAVTGGEIYLVYAAFSFITGWATDRLIASGVSLTWSRKPFMIAAQLIVAAAMAAAAVGGPNVAVASLFVAAAAFGMWTPTFYAVAQSLAGPRASGKWVGLSNGVANLSGILAPLATGFLVDATGSFYAAFAAAGAMSLLAALTVSILIWRVGAVDWRQRKTV